MRIEEQESLVRSFYHDMWNRFDTTCFPRLLERAFRFRGSLGRHCEGWDEFAAYVDSIRAFASDFTNDLERIVSAPGSSFVRVRYSGTHEGEILGRPPTGKRFTYRGAALFDFSETRIREAWVLGDVHGLLQQL